MKIDVFPHIYPAKYLESLRKKVPTSVYEIYEQVERTPGLVDLERRLRILDKYDDVVQVLNIASPPIETMVGPKDAIDLCRLGNDEMAELTAKYPDRFVGAIASLPMNDMEAALSEADRAVRELGFRGVQIYTDVTGLPIYIPKATQIGAVGSAMHGAVAAGSAAGGYDTIIDASLNMAHLREESYQPIAENKTIYDKLFAEYVTLHDYFGRGENDVMKRLKALKIRYSR